MTRKLLLLFLTTVICPLFLIFANKFLLLERFNIISNKVNVVYINNDLCEFESLEIYLIVVNLVPKRDGLLDTILIHNKFKPNIINDYYGKQTLLFKYDNELLKCNAGFYKQGIKNRFNYDIVVINKCDGIKIEISINNRFQEFKFEC